MKPFIRLTATVMAIAVLLSGGAISAHANVLEDDSKWGWGLPGSTKITETWHDVPNFPWTLPGMSPDEAAGGGGGGGSAPSPAGTGGGAGGGGGTGRSYPNPKAAGEKARSDVQLHDKSGKSYSFQAGVSGGGPIVDRSGGKETFLGMTYGFYELLESQAELASAIFEYTGGDFSSCVATSSRSFRCLFREPIVRSSGVEETKPDWTRLAPPTLPAVSTRSIPFCHGTIADAGHGAETVVTLDQVYCEAESGVMPETLRILSFSTDPDGGVPAVDPTGSIHFAPTEALAGSYTWIQLVGVAPNGVESWPFVVGFRNHFSPTLRPGAATRLEGLVGSTTVLNASQWFADEDVDTHYGITQDRLRYEVISNGRTASATVRADGSLAVRVPDDVRGVVDDAITVRAVDRFGLISEELTVPIHITDVVPGCENANARTAAEAPVEVHFTCRLDGAPVGYHQLVPVEYSIASQPEFGTLSGLDSAAGVVTYTPDPAHPGPVTFEFTADNNGAKRTVLATVDVVAAP